MEKRENQFLVGAMLYKTHCITRNIFIQLGESSNWKRNVQHGATRNGVRKWIRGGRERDNKREREIERERETVWYCAGAIHPFGFVRVMVGIRWHRSLKRMNTYCRKACTQHKKH